MTEHQHGVLVFILAVAVGIVAGALSHRYAINRRLGDVAHGAAAVAGFLVGFFVVYLIAANV